MAALLFHHTGTRYLPAAQVYLQGIYSRRQSGNIYILLRGLLFQHLYVFRSMCATHFGLIVPLLASVELISNSKVKIYLS